MRGGQVDYHPFPTNHVMIDLTQQEGLKTQDVRMTNIRVHSKIRVFHSVHSSLDISPKYFRPDNTRQEMRRKRTNIQVKENFMSHIWTLRFDDARKGKQEKTEGQN